MVSEINVHIILTLKMLKNAALYITGIMYQINKILKYSYSLNFKYRFDAESGIQILFGVWFEITFRSNHPVYAYSPQQYLKPWQVDVCL